ncbi:MAG: PEP/pyruvate-binding domain-containing protein [Oscillospiraceae bacterium]|jgi:phosphoenolpyruvate synthase/pyruvate phosphate dikinase|nr:PEP/pyruvate-binding domain-containing protein [Oscillospiraceae bacterium]
MIELLENINSDELQTYGGKASMLSIMMNSAVSVPKGVAVSVDEFFTVVKHPAVKDTVERFWNPVSSEEMLRDACHIKQFIIDFDIAPLVDKVREFLLIMFSNSVDLIYRSSATSEDGKVFSFAGQFLSEPGNINEIEKQIKDVWCSVFEQNVNAYVRNMGNEYISTDFLGMGVIIQEFRKFDVSGVLFSKHPVINIKNWLYIEYSDKPLQQIVHGEIIPSRARVNIETKQVLYENKNSITFHKDNIDEIIIFTNNLKSKMRFEIDVEWGINDGNVIFVQCRPITTLSSD